MTTDLTTSPAVLSLCTVPPASVTYVEIRRDQATYPRLVAVPRDIATAALGKIIFRATFNAAAGSFKDADLEERIALMAAELYDILLEDYDELGTKNLSFAEVARVIRAASVSPDLYGVSVRSLYSAILDYCRGEGHKAFLVLQAERWKHLTLKHEAPAPAPTEEERRTLAASIENLTQKHKAI